MTTDSNTTDHPRHVFWLFVIHMLRALGLEKGRQVLAEVTDLLESHKVWPRVMDDLTNDLSEAYVYAAGLKDEKDATRKVIEHLKKAFAQDHILGLLVEGGIENKQKILDEIEELKRDGYLPDGFNLIPMVFQTGDSSFSEIFTAALKEAGYEFDEFGATKGCGCSRCTGIRAKAKEHEEQGFNPEVN